MTPASKEWHTPFCSSLKHDLTEREIIAVARGILDQGSRFRCRVQGSSMWPFLRSDDWVIVESAVMTSIKQGDIVVFTPAENSRLVIHRVTGTNGNQVNIKGDNTSPDGSFDRDSIIGKAVMIERHGKKIYPGNNLVQRLILLLTRFKPASFFIFPFINIFSGIRSEGTR